MNNDLILVPDIVDIFEVFVLEVLVRAACFFFIHFIVAVVTHDFELSLQLFIYIATECVAGDHAINLQPGFALLSE